MTIRHLLVPALTRPTLWPAACVPALTWRGRLVPPLLVVFSPGDGHHVSRHHVGGARVDASSSEGRHSSGHGLVVKRLDTGIGEEREWEAAGEVGGRVLWCTVVSDSRRPTLTKESRSRSCVVPQQALGMRTADTAVHVLVYAWRACSLAHEMQVGLRACLPGCSLKHAKAL